MKLKLIVLLMFFVFYIYPDTTSDIVSTSEVISGASVLLDIGRICGITGFFLLGLSLFIGGGARFLDRFFGLSNILRYHKSLALLSFTVLFMHPILVTSGIVLDGLSFSSFLAGYLSQLPFIFGITAFTLFLIIILTSLIRKIFNHALWITIHRISIIAFCLAIYHLYKFGVLTGLDAVVPFLNLFIYTSVLLASIGVLIRIFLFFRKKKV